MLKRLLDKTSDDNVKWCINNPTHHLYGRGQVYRRTSCYVTAAMIRDEISGNASSWVKEEGPFSRVRAKHSTFQIAISTSGVINHIFTYCEGMIIQSYHREYEIRFSKFDEKHIPDIDNVSQKGLRELFHTDEYLSFSYPKVEYLVPVIISV